MSDQAIVLFDGDCHMCNSSVQFILKRDSKAFFQFASLQSDIGQRLTKQFGLSTNLDSLVVIVNGCAYSESKAVLEICRYLDGAWKLLVLAEIIPNKLRDFLYRTVAKKRYSWFGKVNACMLPTAEQAKRFLS